jgi:hypothetical protein
MKASKNKLRMSDINKRAVLYGTVFLSQVARKPTDGTASRALVD